MLPTETAVEGPFLSYRVVLDQSVALRSRDVLSLGKVVEFAGQPGSDPATWTTRAHDVAVDVGYRGIVALGAVSPSTVADRGAGYGAVVCEYASNQDPAEINPNALVFQTKTVPSRGPDRR